jgi:cobalamin biosynthesis protein CbiG
VTAGARHAAAGAPRAARAARVVAGVGCSLGCPADELRALVDATVADAGGALVALATVDRRAEEPCMVATAAALGVPLLTHPAAALAAVDVPTPSAVVAKHVGTPSVAEAAALLSGTRLIVHKRRSAHATCAVAQWPE